ncbi:MAG: DUF1592 domain-containing protein [Gemmataceae bacterium]|nr:DUF1592 domain-containing protein [Gemmataceae bacterium]
MKRFPLFAVLLASMSPLAASAQEAEGRVIYMKQCARCHGAKGEGAKEFPHPLAGNRSLPQLVRYVAKTMPEDAPGTCVGPDADKVSKYIFDAFYSPEAQAKIKAPRVELARLTVSEYRNAVADLVGSIRQGKAKSDKAKEGFGLRGEYFNSDAKRGRNPAFNRIDPVVKFDFNSKDGEFEKLKSLDIAATWTGSVIAPETGHFDFIVRTEHSARLWVNDMKKPLIDASVKSGNDTEFKGSLFLIAGRSYPIKYEFSRGQLGVRKDRKDAPPPKTTASLEWKTPHGPADVIPRYYLRPDDAPTSFALSLALPADDRSAGYERGTAISKAWVQATIDGAIETAGYVADHLTDLSGVKADAKDRKKLLQDYCVRFVERAFRRPLMPEQKKAYVERQFEVAKDEETAVKRVVLLTMQSPLFLYREPRASAKNPGDAYDVASRLSFSLWDGLPDAALLKAAAEGKLATRDDVLREAKRMLEHPRAKAKIRAFLHAWLKLEPGAEFTKDSKVFPTFNPAVVADLRTSLDLFLDDVVWSDTPDFRKLLSADYLYLNGRLAKLYGADLPVDAPFQKVAAKAGERFGVATHPYVMAAFAYTATSSPIHRGVFLARNMLGVPLRAPPDAFTPLPAELHPNLNTRERIALQTKSKECQGCHTIINNLGFTLERFDAIGRSRDAENGKPIDSTGFYVTRSGDQVKLKDAEDLAKFLAGSDEAHEAFVARLFHHLVRQPVLAYGPEKLNELRRTFADNNYDIRKLALEITAQTALPRK